MEKDDSRGTLTVGSGQKGVTEGSWAEPEVTV